MEARVQYYKVFVDSLRLHGFHGVFKEEEEIGNTFEFNVEAKVDSTASMGSDNVDDTLNYVDLIQLIKEQNSQRSKTLENLGGRIVNQAFQQFKELQYIKLKIDKVDPPISEEIRSVGIEIEEFAQ